MFNQYCIRKKGLFILINNQNQLYNQIVKYSLYNCTTIIGENVRYFMNKYDISRDDDKWIVLKPVFNLFFSQLRMSTSLIAVTSSANFESVHSPMKGCHGQFSVYAALGFSLMTSDKLI